MQCGTGIMTLADYNTAERLYRQAWERLDHRKSYCLNPLILAAELLTRSGGSSYPEIKRFAGEKGQNYHRVADMLWLAIHS
jgi:hypothetical protein